MSTRLSARNLFPPLDNPELTIQRRSRTDPTLLKNSEMVAEGNGDLPVPDLRNMEELYQPSLNGRVLNSCQFHGLPGDDANKHLDKFLHVTQSIKVNGVIDDALHLYLFPHSLIHHATAWFDRLPRNSINTFEQMAKMFLGKYIDTRPNGEALRKCILSGPYKPTTILVQAVAATDDSPAIPEHTTVETPMNMSPSNKAHFEEKKEAVHLILTGIGDEIYSTVDACQTAQEMWEAIERLQQGESLNIQDVKTNLFWEFGKFTSHDGETMESYYTRFYKLMNEMIRNNLTVATMPVNVQFLQQLQPEWPRFVTIVKQQHKLDEVSYHKLFDILKQYQKEVNELRAERLARNANPLALVATAQANQDPYYQTSKSRKSYEPSSKPSIPTRTHTSTRYKGKEIAKPITPLSETAFEEDNNPEQTHRDKDMQKNLALISKYFEKIYKPTNNNFRTSSNLRNKNVDKTLRYKNDNQSGQFGNQRTMNVAGAKENELEAHYSYMAKIQEVPTGDTGIDSKPLEHVQNDTRYNVFANELQHSKQSESISNTCIVETDDSNVIPDSPDTCDDDIQNDQNDVESDDKRVALANLKLDVDEN
uniref:Reverse transcriptase domain-containing protein n=1 Tax=Tanacetum cinerariifolium TaxID=118510 RepID=A0A699IYD6_TANCI|nr:hypothetical protein [Tanacetum cinerariifolium]